MDIQKFLENPDRQDFNISLAGASYITINLLCQNKITLDSILRRQMEIKEMLQGRTYSEAKDLAVEEFSEAVEKISEASDDLFNKILPIIITE